MSALLSLTESPCQILRPNGSNTEKAFLGSVNFLETNRLKEWKPMDRSGMNQDRSYCYLTVDDRTGIDNLWPESQCSISSSSGINTPFSNSFVTSAFFDDKQDATRSSAVKKCVIEIDRSKVKTDTLNTFWEKMGEIDCQNLANEYQSRNNTLLTINGQLGATLNERKEIQRVNEARITILRNSNDQLDVQIGERQREKTQLIGQLSNELVSFSNAVTACNLQNSNCITMIQGLTGRLSNCTSNLNQYTIMNDDVASRYARSNQIFLRSNVDYRELLRTLSNVDDQIVLQRQKLVTLNSNQWVTSQNLTAVKESLTYYNREWDNCESNLTGSRPILNVATDKWNKMKQSNLDCGASLQTCKTNVPVILSNLSSANASYADCMRTLAACRQSEINLNGQKVSLCNEIDKWMATHQNCTPCNPVITSLQSTIDEILAWCKFPMEAANQLQMALVDTWQQSMSGLQTELQTCELGVNGIAANRKQKEMTALPTITASNRTPPPLPNSTAPTCTVVLSAAYCDPNDRSKCWADKNAYIRFNRVYSQDLGFDINPVVAIPLVIYNDVAKREQAVRDWTNTTYPYYAYKNNKFNGIDDFRNYIMDEYANGRFLVRKPFVYTSKGPGHENIRGNDGKFIEWGNDQLWFGTFGERNNSTGNGRLGEIVELIPNNGAYCSFTTNDGNTHYGSIHAIDHIPKGTKFGYSRTGMQVQQPFGDSPANGNLWDNVNMSRLMLSTGDAGPTCSFSNINSKDLMPIWRTTYGGWGGGDPCKYNYKFNDLPLEKNPIIG